MEVLRRIVSSLIKEGVLEQETTQVSRQIVNQLKLRLSKTKGFVRAFKFRVSAPEAIDVKHIVVSVKRGRAQNEPIVSGQFKSDTDDLGNNEIRVLIEVPSQWTDFSNMLRQLSFVVPEIKDIIRHEFEHLKQPAEDFKRVSGYDLKILEDVIRYWLDPAEVAATVTGMYKNAKSLRQDLGDVFTARQGDVIRTAKNAGADEDEAQEIAQGVLDQWRSYAMKRFPNARL